MDYFTVSETFHKSLCHALENVSVCNKAIMSKVTAPQDAHRRLVLQVYLGSNTSEFSAIHR